MECSKAKAKNTCDCVSSAPDIGIMFTKFVRSDGTRFSNHKYCAIKALIKRQKARGFLTFSGGKVMEH